jgi:hypothetical protein
LFYKKKEEEEIEEIAVLSASEPFTYQPSLAVGVEGNRTVILQYQPFSRMETSIPCAVAFTVA